MTEMWASRSGAMPAASGGATPPPMPLLPGGGGHVGEAIRGADGDSSSTSSSSAGDSVPPTGGWLGLGQLLDGRHTAANVSLYSFALGAAFGCGCAAAAAMVLASRAAEAEASSGSARPWPAGLAAFVALLAAFHWLEYLTTALFHRDVGLTAFLLDHSWQYHMAMTAGVVEYTFELWLVPGLKRFGLLNWA
ncbi:hypothetical protein HK405_008568, partial [Cladochytrium tenue]